MTRIIVTHHNADLDALASLVAARHLYEDAIAVIPNFVSPAVRRYLALHRDHLKIHNVAEITDPVDEVIVVDVRDGRRLTDTMPFIENAQKIVVWDHHPATPHDVQADELNVEPLGACVTMLLEEIIARDLPITPSEATLFLLGLYSDTGRLSYASTQPRDARMASYLLDQGANLLVASRYLRHQYSHEQMTLLKDLLTTVEEVSFDQIEVAFCTARAPRYVDGASVVVHQVMEFGGHDAIVAVLGFDKNDRVQVIARSRVSHIDVGAITRALGGGGHHGAAAATFRHETVEDVVARTQKLLNELPIEAKRVQDLMSTPVFSVDLSLSLAEVQTLFNQRRISGAPVTREGEMIGMISRRDIGRAERAGKLDLTCGSHMTHKVATIDADEPVEDALDLMSELDVGRLPVLREGELVGILTRSDVLEHLYLTALDDSDLTL